LARFSYTAPASGWYTVGAGSYDSDFGYYSLSVTAPSASLEQNLRPSGGDQSVATAEDTAVKPGPIVFSDADGDFLRGILIVSLPAAGTLTVAGTPAAIGQVVLAYDLKDLLWTPPANAYGSNLASFTFEVIDDGFGRRPATDQSPNTITFNVTPVNDAPVIMSGGGGEATGVVVAENSTGVTSVQAVDVDSGVSYAISGADAGLFVVDAATGAVSFRAAPDFELPAAGRNTYAITLLATDGALTDTQALTVTVANAAGNTIIGTKKANTVDASHAIKSLAATGEEDYIDGKKGNDKLNGLGGNDTLIGGAGRDALTGAAGWDRLDGGKDADRFVFSTKFDGSADLIVKFEHDKDEIALKKGVVKAIGSSLSDGEFYAKAGAVKAHDKSDHIIYNKTTGDLYYDKDGKGHTAAIHFATLGNHPGSLDHGDFVIV
jgi:Ca2+-binding RTX toxin-like protein